ncbi:hypothetical protein DQ02_24120 [Citrobacter amalonaticus]|nr:hypothetical protein DQ02_24120 [Citrobacter amalonaticus]
MNRKKNKARTISEWLKKQMGAGGSPAHNEESIDEQGISAGSIPDSPIQLGGLGSEKVRSIRTPAVLSSLW